MGTSSIKLLFRRKWTVWFTIQNRGRFLVKQQFWFVRWTEPRTKVWRAAKSLIQKWKKIFLFSLSLKDVLDQFCFNLKLYLPTSCLLVCLYFHGNLTWSTLIFKLIEKTVMLNSVINSHPTQKIFTLEANDFDGPFCPTKVKDQKTYMIITASILHY